MQYMIMNVICVYCVLQYVAQFRTHISPVWLELTHGEVLRLVGIQSLAFWAGVSEPDCNGIG